MIIGTSQINITPAPGVELSGFAARLQPSIGVLDPLFAKGLYMVEGAEKLLWIHCDLVGFDRAIVLEFRRWAQKNLSVPEDRVMLSATHTHSGPCTIRLLEAGKYDAAYVQQLHAWLRDAAEKAIAGARECELVTVQGQLALAVDRRGTRSAHTDPLVAALGFRSCGGDFRAVIVNYAMHPVALGASNKHISADIPGQAAKALAAQLPGNPIVLISNGACGNLNPPAENVPFSQIQAWGKQIADTVVPLLRSAPPDFPARLRVRSRVVPLPLDALGPSGIEEFAKKALRNAKALGEWGDTYRRTVEQWRASLIAESAKGPVNGDRDAELFCVSVGKLIFLGINAEVFSEFTDWLRRSTDKQVCLVGYANGTFGYLATRAAYQEGGYEVDVAHLFYGCFRAQEGGLEMLAQRARELLGEIASPPRQPVGNLLAPF